MKSNNPFKVHGINYLSPSSMNTYISDLPMWVARYLFGVKSAGGASAMRGIAEEFVLSNKYKNGTFDFNLLETKFMSLCAEASLDLGDIKVEKERNLLNGFGTVLDNHFKYDN